MPTVVKASRDQPSQRMTKSPMRTSANGRGRNVMIFGEKKNPQQIGQRGYGARDYGGGIISYSYRGRRKAPPAEHQQMHVGNNEFAKGKNGNKLITVDVAADRLIVFTTDEGPTVAEKSRLQQSIDNAVPSTEEKISKNDEGGNQQQMLNYCTWIHCYLWASLLTAVGKSFLK